MRIEGTEINEEVSPLYSYSFQKWDRDVGMWLDEDTKTPCNSPEHGFKILKELVELVWNDLDVGSYRLGVFQRIPDEDGWTYELEEFKLLRITKQLEWTIT